MKHITLTTILFGLTLFLLNGCGENRGCNGATIFIPLQSIKCVTGTPTQADIASYEPLQSGDTIIKDDNNATVIIYHDSTGEKKVCLIDNGSSAHILRANP